MSKVLVVYATKSGCTKGVAEGIAERLATEGAVVEAFEASAAPSPEGYDAVLVGSGVRAGSWHASARGWVEANAAALKAVPTAFFTCGLMIAQGETKRDQVIGYTDAVRAASGVEPVDIGLFAGWYEPKAFSLVERGVMKVMKTPPGDYRDWDAIDAWAESIAAKLSVA